MAISAPQSPPVNSTIYRSLVALCFLFDSYRGRGRWKEAKEYLQHCIPPNPPEEKVLDSLNRVDTNLSLLVALLKIINKIMEVKVTSTNQCA